MMPWTVSMTSSVLWQGISLCRVRGRYLSLSSLHREGIPYPRQGGRLHSLHHYESDILPLSLFRDSHSIQRYVCHWRRRYRLQDDMFYLSWIYFRTGAETGKGPYLSKKVSFLASRYSLGPI